MQSRRASLAEAIANVVVGYVVSLGTQLAAFPAFGLRVSIGENLALGAIFSAVSVARSYALRRIFNRSAPQKSANTACDSSQ